MTAPVLAGRTDRSDIWFSIEPVKSVEMIDFVLEDTCQVAFSLDAAGCAVFVERLNYDRARTNDAAPQRGEGNARLERVDLLGTPALERRVNQHRRGSFELDQYDPQRDSDDGGRQCAAPAVACPPVPKRIAKIFDYSSRVGMKRIVNRR